ncbi:single-stranded DNA-binding protein [Flavobacterium sp. LS1R49]|uniref:Single-stranded DNA-binding protein n=1 Tax=Flavobacterium shii TaxID=2987687 RepID=A0A9X2Z941_9FLAO|nr:single-stranded DNA-binding protein [Flavobacterium shii]MCV9926259.1 single-stranded DNA-binding protein [Flavobacterium shii]
MEITGRITKDATIYKVNKDKEVVNFSIAINDTYKPKNSDKAKEIVTYIDCSYWLNAKIAEWLKKGALVQVTGRIGLNVYSSSDGKALGSLTFHTNNIKILAFAKKAEQTPTEIIPQSTEGVKQETADDLPF